MIGRRKNMSRTRNRNTYQWRMKREKSIVGGVRRRKGRQSVRRKNELYEGGKGLETREKIDPTRRKWIW